MWMKRSSTVAQGTTTQRNFLRENKLLVSQGSVSTLRRLERKQSGWRWPVANYELPTAASLARRSGTPPLIETQRRLTGPAAPQTVCDSGQRSEKQIQTEDICDEQFLNAALLKCTEQTHGQTLGRAQRAVCSEADELQLTAKLSSTSSTCLRRTTSNFELGTAIAQRGSLASVRHMLHRAHVDKAVTLSTELNSPATGEQSESEVKSEAENDCVLQGASSVLQLAMPDVTDVEQHPQLDQPLSARTTASSQCQLPETVPETVALPVADEPPVDVPSLGQEQVMLTETQRLALLEAAQVRQRELIWEYNRLPLAMGTLRVRNLKIQLERQLDFIDSELRMLTLPQVFIAQDQLQHVSSISA